MKDVFLGVTLPLASKSSVALINENAVVSTVVMCLQPTGNMVGSLPSNTVQDAFSSVEYLSLSAPTSAPASVAPAICSGHPG